MSYDLKVISGIMFELSKCNWWRNEDDSKNFMAPIKMCFWL